MYLRELLGRGWIGFFFTFFILCYILLLLMSCIFFIACPFVHMHNNITGMLFFHRAYFLKVAGCNCTFHSYFFNGENKVMCLGNVHQYRSFGRLCLQLPVYSFPKRLGGETRTHMCTQKKHLCSSSRGSD